MTDTTTANDVLIKLTELWGLSSATGWDEVGPRVLRAVGERPDGQTVSRRAFEEMAAGHLKFRRELGAALRVDSEVPEALLGQAEIMVKAVDTAAERADGYEETARVMNAERLRLAVLAGTLLYRFESGHPSHPGEPCKQPGHISLRQIAQWREELDRPLPDESEVRTPAGGWLLALSPDRTRIALYDPNNSPWFIPLLTGRGRFVDRSEIEDWTVFTPGPERVLPMRKPVEKPEPTSYVKLDTSAFDPPLPNRVFLFGSELGDELDAALDAWAADRVAARAPQTVWRTDVRADHVDPQQAVVDRFGDLWKPALAAGAYECVSRRGMFFPGWWGLLSERGPLLAADPFALYLPYGWMNRVQELLSYQGLDGDMLFKTANALACLVRSWVTTYERDMSNEPGPEHWGPRATASTPVVVEATPDAQAELDTVREVLERVESCDWDPDRHGSVAEWASQELNYLAEVAKDANETLTAIHADVTEAGFRGTRGNLVATVRTVLADLLSTAESRTRVSLEADKFRRNCFCGARAPDRDELLYFRMDGRRAWLRGVEVERLAEAFDVDDLRIIQVYMDGINRKIVQALTIRSERS